MGLWPYRAKESIANPDVIPMSCSEYQIYFRMQGKTQFNSEISELWKQTWKENYKSKAARCNYQETKYRGMILNYYYWGMEPADKLIKSLACQKNHFELYGISYPHGFEDSMIRRAERWGAFDQQDMTSV